MDGPDLLQVREYTAMALMSCFTITMISLVVWAFRKFVNTGVEGFKTVSAAIDGARGAINGLREATDDNTDALEAHRRDSLTYVERLSREIREAKK